MKLPSLLPSVSRALALTVICTTICITFSSAAQAVPLVTLKGEAFDARDASQSEVRLSVLGWTAPDKLDAIETEYARYLDTQDHTAFQVFLQSQDTQGYLFTKAATGHTIKYAWQDAEGEDQRMVLLLTPALKARTPHMWNTPNNDPAPFSLVEVRLDGDQAVMKTSLETAIETDSEGRLQLQDYDGTAEFGRLRDATPYYLKESG
jgi:hypothetical protein